MIERKIPSKAKVIQTLAQSQAKWWERQGLKSPVVPLAHFEAGRGRVPDIIGEFGYFPTSIMVMGRPKALYDFLADNERPVRHALNAYHEAHKLSIFPPAAAWFAVTYWSRSNDVVFDPFGNRANADIRHAGRVGSVLEALKIVSRDDGRLSTGKIRATQ
ncbi:MAG: hypothetical protein AB1641_09970 [Thermodesulfobacteriota bacterium]